MNLLLYWSHISLIILFTLVPGMALSLRIKALDSIERLAISFGFSFIIALVLIPFFALKFDLLGRLIFASIILISLYYIFKNKSEIKFHKDLNFIVLVLSLSFLSRFFLQTLWEYPVMGGDWFGHAFVRPYRFETNDWMPDSDRTPLFNLLIYVYHRLLGTSLYQYWVSQTISIVMNSVYLFPAYLIAKKAFGGWVAKASTLFMLVNSFLIFNALYTWPKNAAMYGILMMIYFLFFSEHDIKLRYPLAGFFGGIGFWFHNYALFYIGIGVLLLIYKEKMYKKSIFEDLKKLSYFLIVLMMILAPYFAWIYSYYGTFSTSRFIYYPFAVTYSLAVDGTPKEIFEAFHETPVKELVANRIMNTVVTLTPAALPINPIARSFRTYNPIFYYSHDYPGALSSLMYLAVLIWFLRYVSRKRKTDIVLVGFIVLPLFMNLILWGWRDWGMVGQILHPTVPILVMLGINEICNINKFGFRSLLIYLIFADALVEGIIYSKLIINFYKIEGGIDNVSKMGLEFISDFQISNFISAHFLLNRTIDILATFLISVGIMILIYILLYGKVKNR